MKNTVDLSTMKEFFTNHPPPEKSVILNRGEHIKNARSFVEGHIKFLEANKGNHIFMPYFQRLKKFYEFYKEHV